MSRDSEVPLLLILPEHLIESHREMCQRMQNVYYCPWEMARSRTADSLQSQIEKAFGEHGIGEIFDNDASSLTHEQMQERVERRLKNVTTLPTLPAVALRIMAMMEDPRPTARHLEEVLMSDPAIVHKLLQVINSPIFAGGGKKGGRVDVTTGHRAAWPPQGWGRGPAGQDDERHRQAGGKSF